MLKVSHYDHPRPSLNSEFLELCIGKTMNGSIMVRVNAVAFEGASRHARLVGKGVGGIRGASLLLGWLLGENQSGNNIQKSGKHEWGAHINLYLLCDSRNVLKDSPGVKR
jgi:hypothetical protein